MSSEPEELEVIDYELEIAKERETLKPIPCLCGKHTFDLDEIQMDSVCPNCNTHSDGRALGEQPIFTDEEDCSATG